MRKMFISALMISLMLLCGCSGGYEGKLEEFRSAFAEYGTVSFVATMTVQDENSVADYTVECVRTGEETVLRLVEPELISGVTAHLKGKDALIEYEGLSFESGLEIGTGRTPIEACDVVLDTLESGQTSQFAMDGNELSFRVEQGNNCYTTMRLEADTMTPVSAEIYYDGRLVILCTISKWHME